MPTEFATGFIENSENSFEAGKIVAQRALAKFSRVEKPQIALLFCASKYNYQEVIQGIHSLVGEIPLIGCSTAGQFSEDGVTKEGIVCVLIYSTTHLFFPGIGTNLKSAPLAAVKQATKRLPKEIKDYPYHAAILFVDGLAGQGEEAVLAAVSLLGPMVKMAGGAAADDLSFKETVVFGNKQVLQDAISLCLVTSQSPIVISVKHGHHPISNPLKVTRASENILYELEGRPALEVWKDCLREPLRGQGIDIDRLSANELSQWLLKYEIGLSTGEDYKIRFPASCNADGSFNCACSILEGSVVRIMTSDQEDQIESARQAVEAALAAARQVPLAGAIVFDCACRAMILKERFAVAIEYSKELVGNLPFIGGELYGEIAAEMGQLSGFHNTTTVIMLFPA